MAGLFGRVAKTDRRSCRKWCGIGQARSILVGYASANHNRRETSMNDLRSVLAIDLGSGGPKVAVVDETGAILSKASESVSTIFVPGGGAEQDPHAWWRSVDTAVRTALF